MLPHACPQTHQAEEDEDAHSIAARMAPQRAAASRAAQVALFQAVPQHAWLAAQLVSQWVGPEAAVSDGAVRRWTPVADVIKEACRWGASNRLASSLC